MRVCLACSERFSHGWECPACSFCPVERPDGVLVFETEAGDGFEAEYFDELADIEARNFWFRSRNRLIAWAIEEYAPGVRSFLEVGCGNGFVLQGLSHQSAGLELSGGELFDEGLAVARSRLPDISLYKIDARRLPFDAEFDAVGIFDVLEHVREDDTVLQELRRALCPGGFLFVTVPQHRWLWSAADDYARHQRRYTRRELVPKVEAAGFRVVHTTSFIVLLLPLLFASRLRRRDTRDEYDALEEVRLGRSVNIALELVTSIELALTKRRMSWPFGGSLLVVARRAEAL